VDLFKNFIVTLLIFLTSPRIVSSVLSLVGQTFLSGKAINSEIIIDDIAVVDDKTDDTILGEVRNIKRVTMKFLNKSTGVTVR
jgi:hypothetical protein